jgi:hypothetical protein
MTHRPGNNIYQIWTMSYSKVLQISALKSKYLENKNNSSGKRFHLDLRQQWNKDLIFLFFAENCVIIIGTWEDCVTSTSWQTWTGSSWTCSGSSSYSPKLARTCNVSQLFVTFPMPVELFIRLLPHFLRLYYILRYSCTISTSTVVTTFSQVVALFLLRVAPFTGLHHSSVSCTIPLVGAHILR